MKNFGKNKIFAKLSGKYDTKRTIENYGYGEGCAYFLEINPNELLYKEELSFNYYGCDNQIFAVKEYKYILENNNIIKYFTTPENSLFYQLDFVNNIYLKFCRANPLKQKSIIATGKHLCGKDHYNATYIFLNPNSFTLNYQVLGPEKIITSIVVLQGYRIHLLLLYQLRKKSNSQYIRLIYTTF